MDLSTRYLNLRLAHPFMVGASPLADDIDGVKRLEDGGSAAIVLRSLFEEQITLAETGRIHHMDPLEQRFAAALAGFPQPDRYSSSPDQYLEHLYRVKRVVGVPVIASLNGMTGERWLTFAHQIQDAGADALELNMYSVASDPTQSSLALETDIRDTIAELKRHLAIPVALKVGPYFTAFGHFAHLLDQAGVDGLVLFNRFYQPDIDLVSMSAVTRLELSTSAELRLRLRWLSMLHGRVRCSLAATGGIATTEDGIKAIVAGADAVQIVSAILRHGPHYLVAVREGLARWMDAHQFSTLDEIRGRVAAETSAAGLLERAHYITMLQSWAVRK